jgi:hypothetical protein
MVSDKRRDSTQGAAGRSRRASVKIHPAKTELAPTQEVRIADGWLEVTFSVPEIPESSFRYSIGRRYLVIWSYRTHPVQHRFVNLPRAVDPKDHMLRFTNGVVDARIRLA